MNFSIDSVINGRSWLQLPQIPPSSPQNLIHTDVNTNNIPDPNVFVLLYYVNDSDGDTILYEDDNQTELKRVTPKKGRCVFFSNPIPHSAGIPTKNPRMVINYNFTIL